MHQIQPRLCGSLGPCRPKRFFGTFLLGKNPLKFLALWQIICFFPLNDSSYILPEDLALYINHWGYNMVTGASREMKVNI